MLYSGVSRRLESIRCHRRRNSWKKHDETNVSSHFCKNPSVLRFDVYVKTRKPSWRWQTPATQKDAKLLQFDVFRFISPNSISPNFKLPRHSFTRYELQALGLYCYTQFEIRCLPIIKFLV